MTSQPGSLTCTYTNTSTHYYSKNIQTLCSVPCTHACKLAGMRAIVCLFCMYGTLNSHTHTYTYTHTNQGTVRLVWDWLKLSKARAKDKKTWASMRPLFKKRRPTGGATRNMKGCQEFRHENKDTHSGDTHIHMKLEHIIHTNIPTCVHIELGLSKFKLSVWNDSTFTYLRYFCCSFRFIYAWVALNHQHSNCWSYTRHIHSHGKTIKLTIKMI